MPGEDKEFVVDDDAVAKVFDGLGFDPIEPEEELKKEIEKEVEKEVDPEAKKEEIDPNLKKEEEPDSNAEKDPAKKEKELDPEAETLKAAEKEAASNIPAKTEVPKTWRPEAAATWEKIPPEAQAEILKREEDIFKGIEGYKVEANIGKAFKDVVTPFLPLFQAAGADPMDMTSRLLTAHQTLSMAQPAEKMTMFQNLAKHYGISLEGMGKVDENAPYEDPSVVELRQHIATLEGRLNTGDTVRENEIKAEIAVEYDAFAADPKNIYLNEVANDIATLLRSKAVATLPEAYERAVWMNPVTRVKEQARLTAEATAKTKSEAEEKAKAALAATGVNVRTSTKRTSGTASTGSMDDTLKETLAEIEGRA